MSYRNANSLSNTCSCLWCFWDQEIIAHLATIKRDDRDDGRIVGHHLAAEEDTIVAQADTAEEEKNQTK